MLSYASSRAVGGVRASSLAGRSAKVPTGTRSVPRSNGTSTTKRWHTHTEEAVLKKERNVNDIKAAVEARLAGAPKLSDFMAEANPAAPSGTRIPSFVSFYPCMNTFSLL